jgi:hypothetical protein
VFKDCQVVGVNLKPLDRVRALVALAEINLWLEEHQGPWRYNESIVGASIMNIQDGDVESHAGRDNSAWTECFRWRKEQMPHADVLFLVRGAGGFAGGSQEGRLAVLGDACLDALSGDLASCRRILGKHPGLCTRHRQMGAIAHETCHIMGLSHEDGGLAGADYVKFPNVKGPWEPKRKNCFW